MSILTTHNLNIGYSKKGKTDTVQSGLNLELRAGELVCLIGPNGSGKSTLLRTLTGLQKPLAGKTSIDGKEISTLKQREKALLIALVLTERVDIENATVYNIVALGRHPHSSWWGSITGSEDAIIHEAIEMVHLGHKAHCNLNELSDGERQRVMIAKALAQDTPIIMLDEPTAHLDLPNRVEIMLLLHRLAHKTDKSILLSTHELDLALQAADRIWLISPDRGVECGVPEDLVFNGSFNHAFESKAYFFNAANGNFSMNYPMTKKVWVEGDKTRMYWTLRALARAGYMVVQGAETVIFVTESGWELKGKTIFTIEDLLNNLQLEINSSQD
jgi:iron complex transport system ATP-binding protein